MTRSLIVCYSLMGSTMRVADAIAAGLRAAGHEVDVHNLTEGDPPSPDGYDALVVGTPTYFYRPPFPVMDFLADLPRLDAMHVAVFVLSGTYQGDTGTVVRRALREKGAAEAGYLRCRGADVFIGYLKEGYLFSPDRPTAEDLVRAQAFGRSIAGVVAGGAYSCPPDDPPAVLLYRLERALTARWLTRRVYSRLFRVRRKVCTTCGLCVRGCPTRNVVADEAGRPTWGRECVLCGMCAMRCPVGAIVSPITWPVFRPFMVLNTRRAARDPAVAYARVELCRGGRIERL